MKRRSAMLFAAVVAATMTAPPALARVAPLPQRVLSRGAQPNVRPTPLPARHHALFGAIVQLLPNGFVLRLRSGRLERIDDTLALQSGNYSSPLFVGKVVVAEGNYDAKRMLHAVTVTRMNSLDGSLPPDR